MKTVKEHWNTMAHAYEECQIEEPMPPIDWKTDYAGRYEGYIETPVYMIMKLKK